jgi:hypothetical protein
VGAKPVVTVPSIPQPSLDAPAVLAECLPGGLTGTEDNGPAYPVPPNSIPHQEAGTVGRPVTAAAAACAPVATPVAAPVPAGTAGALGNTAAPPSAALPDTGLDPDVPIIGAVLGAGALAARAFARGARPDEPAPSRDGAPPA